MRFNTAGGANVISSKSENRQEKTALLCLDIDGPVLRGFPVFLTAGCDRWICDRQQRQRRRRTGGRRPQARALGAATAQTAAVERGRVARLRRAAGRAASSKPAPGLLLAAEHRGLARACATAPARGRERGERAHLRSAQRLPLHRPPDRF